MSEVNVTQGMQELLSRLPKTETHTLRSVLNPEYTREHIALSLTPGNVLRALFAAREARELAVSWRDFKVGAAVVGMTFQPSGMRFMTCANVKPDEDSTMNVHAEQVALQKARDRNFDAVSIVAVVGETQSDTQSGNEMHTLHPCGLCRAVMLKDALVDPKASLIVSALPDFTKIELYNLDSLHAFHTTNDSTGIHKFELPHLKMFEPAPTNVSEYILEDTPESVHEERIWNGTIGTYVANRRFDIMNSLN